MSREQTRQQRAELEALEKAIVAQEALRGTIANETLEITLSALRAQRDALQAQLDSGKTMPGEGDAPDTLIGIKQKVGTAKPGSKVIGAVFEYVQGNVYVGSPPQDDAEALRIYRQVLVSSCKSLPLRGVDVGASDASTAGQCLSLAQVYINLDTKTAVPTKDLELLQAGKPARKQVQSLRAVTSEDARMREELQPLPVLVAAAHNPRMVLLGDPGSGKTTFLRRLALGLAAHALDPGAGWLKTLAGWPTEKAHLIPIVLLLRDFAQLAAPHKEKAQPEHLWKFIVERLERQNLGFAKRTLATALEEGRALVLLDGLDEVPTPEQRVFARDAVHAFMERYKHTSTRFIITCRTLSYQDPGWQLAGTPSFELAPFSEKKIGEFIQAWYAESGRLGVVRREDADGLAKALSQAVRRPDLWRLAPNPLLLTVMALVHTHKGRLPEARALLYEDTVDILLWRWEQIRPGMGGEPPRLRQLLLDANRGEVDLKRVLGELAYRAHAGASAEDSESLADIDETALQRALATLHPTGNRDWAQQVIEQMKLRAGLLLERAPGVYTLPHRTFQEYLAGLHLSAQGDFARRAAALVEGGDLWRQVVLLAAGRLVYLSSDTDKPLALVGELCPAQAQDTEVAWRKAWWAGEVLVEMGLNRVRDSTLGRDLLARVRLRLAELLDKGRLAPLERAAAARALAQLDDPRRGVGCTSDEMPDIVWVEVPAGEFVMGEGKERHPIKLPPFYMSRYLVTNAQFAAFVRAGGYKEEHYWAEAQKAKFWRSGEFKGARDREPRSAPYDFGVPFNLPNHPVVGVSWYEALAFCRWLEERWQHSGGILHLWRQEGMQEHRLSAREWRLILPSEAEWEKAARGTDGRTFPWGEEVDANKANYDDSRIGSTSAVGCFPDGRSVFDALDMAGNVWEWTRSLWGKGWEKPEYRYPYDLGDRRREDLTAGPDVWRVLRGGAFYNGDGALRCALRYGNSPGDLDGYFGFRLVLSPIPSAL